MDDFKQRRFVSPMLAAALAGIAAINVRSTKADSVALTPTISTGSQYFDYLFGLDFNTDVPITITQLGVFDNNDSGMLELDNPIHPITIQVFNRTTGIALATTYFGDGYSTGTDTTVGSGQVFFQTLATPLSLPAGGQYYISEDYAGAEGFGNVGAGNYTPSTVNNSGAITFVGTGRASLTHGYMYIPGGGTGFTSNGFIDQGPANRYTGPNFKFTASVSTATWAPTNLGNIMPLGDSITYGVGSSYGTGYRLPLYNAIQSAGFKSTYVGSSNYNDGPMPVGQENHDGLPGYVIQASDPNDTSATGSGRSGILDGISTWLGNGPSGSNPQFILLMIGTNDVDLNYFPGTPQGSEQGARLAALIDAISNKTTGLRPASHLIVAQIPPTETPSENVLVQDYNHYVAQDVAAAQSAGENVTMVDMYDALNPATDLANNLHPNDAGYAKMTQVWLQAIESITAPPPPIHVAGGEVYFFPVGTTYNGVVETNTPGITIDSGGKAVVTLASVQSSRQLLVPNNGLTLAGSAGSWSGQLDLTNNDLDLANASLATVTGQIREGYNNGSWTGNGISSSAAAGDSQHLTALGVIQNNQSGIAIFTATNPFDTITPGVADILVKFTYYGDTNLDGIVDGSDYSRIDSAYLADKTSPGSSTGWFNGDFNYDGVIDGSDYTLIDNTFNSQGAALTAAIATSQAVATAVPEPTMMAVGFLVTAGFLRRRARVR